MIEFEEPREIPASHLVRARCRECGADALCVPERAQEARCGTCMGGGATVPLGTYTPVRGYTLGEARVPAEVVASYPRPTVSMALPFECPAPVISLAAHATAAGWQHRMVYSHGHFPHGTTGRPGAQKHVISLRFGGHALTRRQAYAVYARPVTSDGWTWQSVAIWGPDLPPYLGCGLAALRVYLAEHAAHLDTEALARWVNDLRSMAVSIDAAKKVRDVKRAEIKKLYAQRCAKLSAVEGPMSEESLVVAGLAAEFGETVEDVRKIVSKSNSRAKREGN